MALARPVLCLRTRCPVRSFHSVQAFCKPPTRHDISEVTPSQSLDPIAFPHDEHVFETQDLDRESTQALSHLNNTAEPAHQLPQTLTRPKRRLEPEPEPEPEPELEPEPQPEPFSLTRFIATDNELVQALSVPTPPLSSARQVVQSGPLIIPHLPRAGGSTALVRFPIARIKDVGPKSLRHTIKRHDKPKSLHTPSSSPVQPTQNATGPAEQELGGTATKEESAPIVREWLSPPTVKTFLSPHNALVLPTIRPYYKKRPISQQTRLFSYARHFYSTQQSTSTQADGTPQTTPILNTPTYFVERSASGNLPVYTDYKGHGTLKQTVIRKVSGDSKQLKEDLVEHLGLEPKNAKVIQPANHVVLKGAYIQKVMEYLKDRGF